MDNDIKQHILEAVTHYRKHPLELLTDVLGAVSLFGTVYLWLVLF